MTSGDLSRPVVPETVKLDAEQEEALEELSNKNDFWTDLYDDFLQYGHLTNRQYARLVEEMNG